MLLKLFIPDRKRNKKLLSYKLSFGMRNNSFKEKFNGYPLLCRARNIKIDFC